MVMAVQVDDLFYKLAQIKLSPLKRSGWVVELEGKNYFILHEGPEKMRVFIEHAENKSKT